MAEHSQEQHHQSDGHHIVPPKVYLAVFAALMVLTALTVWAATLDLHHPWSDVVALTIAVTKATLVVLFFMHVKYSVKMIRLTVLSGVLWLVFLLVLLIPDFVSRDWIRPPL